jgi:hypothetical protein
MKFDFTYELPNGMEIMVEAEYFPGDPGRYGPSVRNEDAYPPEPATVEVERIHLLIDGKPGPDFEAEGFYVQKFVKYEATGTTNKLFAKFATVPLEDAIYDAAMDEAETQGES